MAILEQGPIGNFRGKMGSIVISKWKDSYVGKSKSRKSGKPATPTQLVQRAKFRLMGEHLSSLSAMISIGFKETGNTTSMNEAMRYNLAEAISGIYPDLKLDYAKLAISDHKGRGRINYIIDPVLLPVVGGRVKLSWKLDEEPQPNTKPTDLLYVVFYHPLQDLHTIKEVVRTKLTTELRLSRLYSGEVHVWIFIASDNKKFVTPTDYLGKITVID